MFKVIVVDDEFMIKQSLRKIIDTSEHHFKVVAEADDGQEALQLVKELKPDLIVTDIRMPHMDGLELLHEVKKIMPAIQSIVITGYGEFDYAQQAVRLHVSDYILKPIKPLEVNNVLERISKKLIKETEEVVQKNEWSWLCQQSAAYWSELIWHMQEDVWNQEFHKIMELTKSNDYKYLSQQQMYATMFQFIHSEFAQLQVIGEIPKLTFVNVDEADEVLSTVKTHVNNLFRKLRETRNWVKHHKIKEAVSIIHDQFQSPSTNLQQVADAVEMSATHFSRSFKEELGQSFVQYLTSLRIEEAKRLCADPLYKIYEIAELVGYTDYPHFSKTFKKYCGLSPNEYRNSIYN